MSAGTPPYRAIEELADGARERAFWIRVVDRRPYVLRRRPALEIWIEGDRIGWRRGDGPSEVLPLLAVEGLEWELYWTVFHFRHTLLWLRVALDRRRRIGVVPLSPEGAAWLADRLSRALDQARAAAGGVPTQ